MSNRRIRLTEDGKKILDLLTEQLEVDRPTAIHIALAKGIQISDQVPNEEYSDNKNKWTIPDNIIKEQEFLLFKHLIINEVQTTVDDETLHDLMRLYIEKGLRKMHDIYKEKTSMEDLRISIL